jgi:hypothetical protein
MMQKSFEHGFSPIKGDSNIDRLFVTLQLRWAEKL